MEPISVTVIDSRLGAHPIVVHGGAGVIERKDLSPEQETAYRAAMNRAIQAGAAVLTKGGSALDAIETTIKLMEDDPLFNAGRGAVFTAEGRNELDAAIMDGKTLAAGSIAGVTRTRHPISLARRVMEKSPHVMLISTGADTFSKEQGLEQVEPGWFYTERRWRALEKFLKEKSLPIPPKPAGAREGGTAQNLAHDEGKKGTVGVAALDMNGNIAAGTSTGGTTGKRWGRVGDSPIIGAGTYASNTSCAVSATGTGEYFIRLDGRARDLRAGRAQGNEAAGSSGRSRAEAAHCDRRRRRNHRCCAGRSDGVELQHVGHVSRKDVEGSAGGDRDL